MDMGIGMMGIGLVVMLILFVMAVGAVALVVWAIVHFTHPASGGDASARRILDERYARGEIDDDEYTRRKRQLS